MWFLEEWNLNGIFTHPTGQPVAIACTNTDQLHETAMHSQLAGPLSGEDTDPLIPSPSN
jgi:hypothetical protein